MRRTLYAAAAICGLLLAGCVHTPTDGQKAAQRAAQPSVTVIQPTTDTKTCEGPCTTTRTSSSSGRSTTPSRSATAPARTATQTGSASAATATKQSADSTSPPYSRDQFGNGWADPDGNGCDGRQDAIARATTDQHRTSKCYIATGDVTDWYTGVVCNDCPTRSFDVDHVVALKDAWDSGASQWTRDERVAYANDPLVLAITDASTNRSKGAQGPESWAPANHAAACEYVRRYAVIKFVYGLVPTPGHETEQTSAIRRTLATC